MLEKVWSTSVFVWESARAWRIDYVWEAEHVSAVFVCKHAKAEVFVSKDVCEREVV